MCKHSCHEHNTSGIRQCQRARCACAGFTSKHSCSCGQPYDIHETVFEKREEREMEGRPVDPKWMQEGNMIGGMGGLQHDMMALADDSDKRQMRDPNAIMGNMQAAG